MNRPVALENKDAVQIPVLIFQIQMSLSGSLAIALNKVMVTQGVECSIHSLINATQGFPAGSGGSPWSMGLIPDGTLDTV